MTGAADLERGYRRWLRWYPKEFRREHEEEILAVLMARSIGRGHRWARIAFALFFGLNTWGLFNGLAGGSAVYARPDLAVGSVLWLVELAAVARIFHMKRAVAPSSASRITPTG